MRVKALIVRIIREFLRDYRTLILMVVMPLVLLTLMNYIFQADQSELVKIGMTDNLPVEIVDTLKEKDIRLKTYASDADPKKKIEKDDLTAFLAFNDKDEIEATYQNEDPAQSDAVKMMLGTAILRYQVVEMKDRMEAMGEQAKTLEGYLKTLQEKLQTLQGKFQDLQGKLQALPGSAQMLPELEISAENQGLPSLDKKEIEPLKKLTLKSTYLYGDEDSTYFDRLFPILIGFFVFFFVFLISGIGLLQERTHGTLDRVLATPVRRSEIVFGYLVGYGLFALIQTTIVVLYSVFVLNLNIVGNLGWVFLISGCIALVALVMGIFISTFANSEFQMMQFLPIIVVPQIFFSGMIPLDGMAKWLQYFSYIFPLRYGGDALTEVIIKGGGFDSIAFDLGMLLVFLIGFTMLNIFGLKRYRKV